MSEPDAFPDAVSLTALITSDSEGLQVRCY